MENFVVSARKYRPDTFQTVVAQASITSTLKNAIKSRQLAHAYLFCGPRGVGKTTCARIFAKTINCTNLSPEVEACNNVIHAKRLIPAARLIFMSWMLLRIIRLMISAISPTRFGFRLKWENTACISSTRFTCFRLRHLMHF